MPASTSCSTPTSTAGATGPRRSGCSPATLFEDRGHHRIVIDPNAANAHAIHAYEKVGFRRVGTLRQYEWHPDRGWTDGLLLDLLRDELTEAP